MNRSNVGASSDTTHFLMDAGLMIFSFGIIAMAFHSNITQQELIIFFDPKLCAGNDFSFSK